MYIYIYIYIFVDPIFDDYFINIFQVLTLHRQAAWLYSWNKYMKEICYILNIFAVPSKKLIDTEWGIYASVNYIIIGSDNGAKPLSEPMLEYC